MGLLERCPLCASRELRPVDLGPPGAFVTSDSRPAPGPVGNVLCDSCGLVANATGARGRTDGFYQDEYDLLAGGAATEFLIYEQTRTMGVNEGRFEFLIRHAALPDRGRLLEIGAGKGMFLHRFTTRFPGWAVCAVEPSRNAIRYFREILPAARVHEGPFESSPFRNEQFDVVTAFGVLEHVPAPAVVLSAARRCLAPGGVLCVEVPNFHTNPSDLLCYDHLTRFVPETLAATLHSAGFRVTASSAPAGQVPMRFLAAVAPVRPPRWPAAPGMDAVLAAHVAFIRATFASYARCAEASDRAGGRMALFGLGIVGLAGILRGHAPRDRVATLLDDNEHFWGADRLGIPVGGLDLIRQRGITHVAFAANPCYLERMMARLRDFPVRCFPPAPGAGAGPSRTPCVSA